MADGQHSESDARSSMGGRKVVLLEARRATELANLVRRHGGEPWSVPAMREVPLEDRTESVKPLRELLADGADLIICLTGVGTRALFELAGDLGLGDELRRVFGDATVVVRGPKPTAVLRELGIRIDRAAAEPNTTKQVLEVLGADSFERVAIQLYGAPDVELSEALTARGSRVLELPLYRWSLPVDSAPLLELIDRIGEAQAMAITSASQVNNLFTIAEQNNRVQKLLDGLKPLVIAAVGPVAARALLERGVHVDVEPEHPHMGAMVRDLAGYFSRLPG